MPLILLRQTIPSMKVEKEKSGHYFMRREVNNTLKIKIVSVAANFYGLVNGLKINENMYSGT